jgi:hypothetical protein
MLFPHDKQLEISVLHVTFSSQYKLVQLKTYSYGKKKMGAHSLYIFYLDFANKNA